MTNIAINVVLHNSRTTNATAAAITTTTTVFLNFHIISTASYIALLPKNVRHFEIKKPFTESCHDLILC